MRDLIVFAGNFKIQNMNAAGRRVAGLAAIVVELGYKPVFVETESCLCKETPKQTFYKIKIHNNEYDVFTLPYPSSLWDWMRVGAQKKRLIDIIEQVGQDRIKSIVLYGSPCASLWVTSVIAMARKMKIPIITDCVDWIQHTSDGLLRNLLKFVDTNYQKRWAILKSNGVITISTYLQNYYSKRKKLVVMIPPVSNREPGLNLLDDRSGDGRKGKIVFTYAGVPFDIKSQTTPERFKDRIDKTIEFFFKIYQRNKYSILNIVGLDKKSFLSVMPSYCNLINSLSDNIVFHGKCEMEVAKKVVQASDFIVLHRDDNLVTRAGFPSKISEAILLGIPVIANDVGDMSRYIKDNHNGFLLSENNEKDQIDLISGLTYDEMYRLKKNCQEDGNFDYREYVGCLNDFFVQIENTHKS